MDLRQSVYQLLREIGPGRMVSTAYDTAWVARLAELGEPMGERALEWLRAHQLTDGSWGASEPWYSHDRLISTLAAVTTLARQGCVQDRARLRRARLAMETATERLANDRAGATAGFELIVPMLIAEAEALGVIQYKDSDLLDQLRRWRAAKLVALPGRMVNRFVSTAFSAEMAGLDGLHLLDVENLQEANGSVGCSPSTTAYFALHVVCHDSAALGYLREVTDNGDGSVPAVMPFDVFEQAWVLWNLALAGPLDDKSLALCRSHLDFLEAAWRPGQGVGFALGFTPCDVDDTSIAYEVLTRFGRSVDLDGVLCYEENEQFRLFALETHPSISANVHALGALRQAGLEAQHPSVQKILRFLRWTQTSQLFWFDKLHASPYYPTAHAVVACTAYADELVSGAIGWIADTQNTDGSWGYYMPTAEETAYCLQALITWRRHGGKVPDDVLKRGAGWLAEHTEPPYPPLMIAKCLYCPELVVRSTILSAMMLVEQES